MIFKSLKAKELKELRKRMSPRIYDISYLSLRPLKDFLSDFCKQYLSNQHDLLILDIGCGIKPYMEMFDEYYNKYFGLDLFLTSQADLLAKSEMLPIKENSIDVVLCTQVLEHTQDFAKATEEIHRVLNKNGVAVITLPFVWPLHGIPYDYWRFSKYAIKKMFKGKFKEVIIKESNGYMVSIISLLLELTNVLSENRKLFSIILSPFYVIFNLLGLFTEKIFNNPRFWKIFSFDFKNPLQTYRLFPLNYFVVVKK